MTTNEQERWMALVELLNSDVFDSPCSWFEDSDGNQSTSMANRTTAAEHVPTNTRRMRIDGRIWVRGDDWIDQDIQLIKDKLSGKADYLVRIVDDTLYIKLSPNSAA